MCCLFTTLALLGPRIGILVWWIMQPVRWQATFTSWLWPLLGFFFLPWTTIMYVAVAPNGLVWFDWIWLAMAFVVGPDNGDGMKLRLDLTGKHPIGAGSSSQAVYQSLVVAPLERAGLAMLDVDRYAVEMHNPEITEPGDSGDVPKTNYRTLAAMAVMRGEIQRDDMDDFTATRGMPGFAPTQGHIPAGVPYLGHAHRAMRNGELDRAMIVAKGSLFLGRMTQLVDGVSFVIERDVGPTDE